MKTNQPHRRVSEHNSFEVPVLGPESSFFVSLTNHYRLYRSPHTSMSCPRHLPFSIDPYRYLDCSLYWISVQGLLLRVSYCIGPVFRNSLGR